MMQLWNISPEFNTLSEHNKILFLFNNVDPFICIKNGLFSLRGFPEKKTTIMTVIHCCKLIYFYHIASVYYYHCTFIIILFMQYHICPAVYWNTKTLLLILNVPTSYAHF